MDLSSYLLQGFALLPKLDITVDGEEVECLFNTSTHRDNKVMGGYEPDMEAIVYIKTSLLTNPRQLKGKICVINEEDWRVLAVRYGADITSLTVISVDAS